MHQGRMKAFGPKDKVLSELFPRPQPVDGGRLSATPPSEKPGRIIDATRKP
jgi:hypothetical protein